MDMTRLFQRVLLTMVLVGLSAIWLAEANPFMLLVAVGLALCGWYYAEASSGRGLPHWLTTPIVVLAAIWLAIDVAFTKENIVRPIALFIVWVQLLLMAEKKDNRQYAHLLGISVALAMGAAVLGDSPFFIALLATQMVLAFIALLLLRLKVSEDQVLAARKVGSPSSVELPAPPSMQGPGYRAQLRWTSLGICVCLAAVAALIVGVAPRGELNEGNLDVSAQRTRASFTPVMRLADDAPLTGSDEAVLTVRLSLGDRNLGSEEETWLLRGAVLDHYHRRSRSWRRSEEIRELDQKFTRGRQHTVIDMPQDAEVLSGEVRLLGGRDDALFTMHPLVSIAGPLTVLEFNAADQQLARTDRPRGPLTYTFQTAADASGKPSLVSLPPSVEQQFSVPDYARGWTAEVDAIRALTLSVIEEAGLTRDIEAIDDPNDDRIARAIEEYLLLNYTYDLAPPRQPWTDPVHEFLFTHKRGHCELFSGALAAMARSIGMRARVITGYRLAEFGTVGNYYVARHEDAHAWCEVYVAGRGWITLDPTPIDLMRRSSQSHPIVVWLRNLHERITFAGGINGMVAPITGWATGLFNGWQFGSKTSVGLVAVLVAAVAGAASLLNTMLTRRRRLRALQLSSVPTERRRELARELSFYLHMTDLLERRGHIRPHWQSPFTFAHALAADNPQRFAPVVSLTEIFYEIRFGQRAMDDRRRNLVETHLRQLQQMLAQNQPGEAAS